GDRGFPVLSRGDGSQLRRRVYERGELPPSGLPSQLILLLPRAPSPCAPLFCDLHLRALFLLAGSRHRSSSTNVTQQILSIVRSRDAKFITGLSESPNRPIPVNARPSSISLPPVLALASAGGPHRASG